MLQHVNITVSGKVQGVFYRAATEKVARELDITGWVQNLPSGEVYIEAEGTEEQLRQFTDWCRKGPSRATVTAVEIVPSEVRGFAGFTIRR